METTREAQLDWLTRLFDLLGVEPCQVTPGTTLYDIGADDVGLRRLSQAVGVPVASGDRMLQVAAILAERAA